MPSQELVSHYLAMLQSVGRGVTIDLTDEPVVVLAYSSTGRVFAAAWESDEGLVVRLRLDAMAADHPEMEHIEGGSLAYEVVMHSPDEVDSLGEMLMRANDLAGRRGDR